MTLVSNLRYSAAILRVPEGMRLTFYGACGADVASRPRARCRGRDAAAHQFLVAAPACALVELLEARLLWPHVARNHLLQLVLGSAVRPSEDGVDATTGPTN